MNFRTTAALFAAVAVIGVVLLVLSLGEGEKGDTGVLARELAAAGAKPDDIDTLELERPGVGTLLIVRTDKDRNAWQIQKPITAAADAGRVGTVVADLLRAKPTPYKELRPDPAAHGLAPPSLKATIKQGDRSSTINFGNVTLGDKGVVFVTTSAQPDRPMAVPRGEVGSLFRTGEAGGTEAGSAALWTSDLRTKSGFPSDSRAMGEDVAYLKLELPNQKKEVALARGPGGRWQFESPAGWGAADAQGDPVPSTTTFTGVTPLIRTLTNVSAATAGDFIDNPGDLKQYGLNPDNPDLARVTMRTKDGQSAVVLIGKAVPPDPKAQASPAGGGQV